MSEFELPAIPLEPDNHMRLPQERIALRHWAHEYAKECVAAYAATQAQQASPAVSGAEPSEQFFWLVEMFHRGGNSLGRYHTGFTDLGHASRATSDVHQARRYSKDAAEKEAGELNQWMKSCEWRAIEHGFTAERPSGAEPELSDSDRFLIERGWAQLLAERTSGAELPALTDEQILDAAVTFADDVAMTFKSSSSCELYARAILAASTKKET